jgi:hypothetical protein
MKAELLGLPTHSRDSAARQGPISAQRSRPLLIYAQPHLAVRARIELTRVHLAFGDLAGAMTLMGEIDELLRRRPGLGTLVGEGRGAWAVLRAWTRPTWIFCPPIMIAQRTETRRVTVSGSGSRGGWAVPAQARHW